MTYSRLLTFALIELLLFFRCESIIASPLTNDDASALASAYLEAEYDERTITYQVALSQLEFIQSLDAVLTKARPSPAMTMTSPAWKAARSELLTQTSPELASIYAKERTQQAYETIFASSLSLEEARVLLSFLSSAEGKQYFQAIRLLERKKVIERYILTVATNRSNLPEPIPSQIVRNDMEQLSHEDKNLGKPDKVASDRLKTIAEEEAWKKLQGIQKTVASEVFKGWSSEGRLNKIRELMKQIVYKAISNFKASKEALKQ